MIAAADTTNVTLRLKKQTLKKGRIFALEQDKSLSRLVEEFIENNIQPQGEQNKISTVFSYTVNLSDRHLTQEETHQHKSNVYQNAKQRALKRLQKGFDLGGKYLTREKIYQH